MKCKSIYYNKTQFHNSRIVPLLLSRRINSSYLNQTSTNYTYDSINRLTELTNTYNPTPNTYTYTYDSVGNRLTKQDSSGTENYTYDNIYQLTNVTYPDTTTTYNYDSLGNRTTTISDTTTTTYTTNNLNQYTSIGNTTYTYDNNGNLTKDNTNTYTYDSENRLTGATVIASGSEAIYTYDPFGRRISKTIDGTTTSYLYDGDQVICEYEAGAISAKYVYGSGIDEVLTMERGGATYYYHYDGLDSVTEVTDSTGTVVEKYEYDVYGKPTIKDPSDNVLSETSIGNSYLFTARRYDSNANLFYYRARYYNPTIGKFLQTDPIGYTGGINLYTYVGNNPVNFVDPFGLDKKKEDIYPNITQLFLLPKNLRNALLDYMLTYGAIELGGTVGVGLYGVTGEFIFSSRGIQFKFGPGFGIGMGLSAAYNPYGPPSPGKKATFVVRGGKIGAGGAISVDLTEEGLTYSIVGGYGFGLGATLGPTYTTEPYFENIKENILEQ